VRPSIATALAAVLILTAGTALAAPMIESSAAASTIYYSESPPYPEITSNEDEDASGLAGARVDAAVLPICPAGCAIVPPGPNDPWYYGTGAAASARTDYGVNQARAYALYNDNYPSDVPRLDSTAGARSFWRDELTLLPLPPSAPAGTLEIEFRLDAFWENFGAFEFISTLTWSGGPGAPSFEVDGGIGSTGDESGSLDESFTLVAPYFPGATYNLWAELVAQTPGGYEASLVDAFSTARVTRTLVPSGGGLISAAGALDAYNVVPEPGSGALLATGVAGLAWLARRRAVARNS
jgi:hypothetical protein